MHKLNRALNENDLAQQTQAVIRDSGPRAQQDFGWLNAENRCTVANIEKAIVSIRAGLGFGWLPVRSIQQQLKKQAVNSAKLALRFNLFGTVIPVLCP